MTALAPALPRLWPAYLLLLAVGAAWGLTTPLVKIATSHGHPALSIALWQAAMTVIVLGAVQAARGRLHRTPRDWPSVRLYLVFGLFGLALPQWASFTGTTHLPAGIMSIVISLVPIFALPLALALGTERFSARRLAGVALGAAAIVMLTAPGASLPEPGLWVWVLVGALAPLFYAFEGAYVAASRAPGAGPFQLLWAASVVATFALIGLNLAFGGFRSPLDGVGPGELAVVAAGGLSMVAFAGYITLLQRWGAVFGAQVAYTVTGCGIVWAMIILGERYPSMVWAALAVLFAGLFLVQPRRGTAAAVEVVTNARP